MKKKWLFWGALLALPLVVLSFTGCAPVGRVTPAELPAGFELRMNSQQQGIWVSGEGEVTVTPDIANLRLGISAQSVSVADAQTQATEAMDRVMAALTDNGVAKKDIQTQRFSISQVTRWDDERREEEVVGYRVNNTVLAKIRDIDKVGSIIDAVSQAGGDFTRIEGISFSVDDPTGYQEEARQKAFADAKAKAEQMADLAGVKLGKPTYISESSYMPSPVSPRVMYEKAPVPAPAGAPTQISPGEMDITVTVQIAYAIQ